MEVKNDPVLSQTYGWVDQIDNSRYDNLIGVNLVMNSVMGKDEVHIDLAEAAELRLLAKDYATNRKRDGRPGKGRPNDFGGKKVQGYDAANNKKINLSQHHKYGGLLMKNQFYAFIEKMTDQQLADYFNTYINHPNNKLTLDRWLNGQTPADFVTKLNRRNLANRVEEAYTTIYWNQSNLEMGPDSEYRGVFEPQNNLALKEQYQGLDVFAMTVAEQNLLISQVNNPDALGKLTDLAGLRASQGASFWEIATGPNVFNNNGVFGFPPTSNPELYKGHQVYVMNENTSRMGERLAPIDFLLDPKNPDKHFDFQTGNLKSEFDC